MSYLGNNHFFVGKGLTCLHVIHSTYSKFCSRADIKIENACGHKWIIKVKLVTLVEGNPKAPISIATTPRCWGGCYSILWITPLYPWFLPYNAKCEAMQHQVLFFKSLVWLDMELNPGLPDYWWTHKSFSQMSIIVTSFCCFYYCF